MRASRFFGALMVAGMCALPVVAANPDIGKPGDREMETVFTFAGAPAPWTLTVYSYVFAGTGGVDAPDVSFPEPGPGQTLFVYVLETTSDGATYPASVDQYVVQNPIPTSILAVGFNSPYTPGGFTGTQQNPSFLFEDQSALSVLYGFAGANTLDPGAGGNPATIEYAVVYFLADSPFWGPVQGSVQGGLATTDVQDVLGPVPEPVTLGLMLVGGIFVIRRRKTILSGGAAMAVALAIGLAGMSSSAFAQADIGGTPAAPVIERVYNGAGTNLWHGKVTSYVYDVTSGGNVPAGLPVPGAGQTLFVYLVENIGAVTDPSITSWTVANDFPPLPIVAIGTEPSIVPVGHMVTGSAQQSNSQIVNPLSQVFTWQNGIIFNPFPTVTTVLQPDHYSVEWFLVDSTYQLVNGTLQSAAQPETQLVYGPLVPEPASLGLLAVGLLLASRRRR